MVLNNSQVIEPAGTELFNVDLTQNVSTSLLGADSNRTFLLIYNPANVPVQIALASSITAGTVTNLMLGPGEAYFWATSYGLSPCWTGPISAISLSGAYLPIWFWTDGSGFWNNGGVLCFPDAASAAGWPTSDAGLAPGALWNNGLVVAMKLPVSPSPTAAPVYFGGISAPQLLALGGGNLPGSAPAAGSGQIWSLTGSGEIWVA
jgi:hypothetical protein